MRAMVLEKPGDITNLKWRENVSKPKPGKEQVLLKINACAVCYRDILDRKGAFPFIKK